MTKIGLVLFLQYEQLFEPVDSEITLARAMLENLSRSELIPERLCVVSTEALRGKTEGLLREFESKFKSELIIRERPMRPKSLEFLDFVSELFTAAPSFPWIVSGVQASALDWDFVSKALQRLKENPSVLVIESELIRGWGFYAFSPGWKDAFARHREAVSQSPCPLGEISFRLASAFEYSLDPGFELPDPMLLRRIEYRCGPLLLERVRKVLKASGKGIFDLSLSGLCSLLKENKGLISQFPESLVIELSTFSSAFSFYGPLAHLGDKIQARGKFMSEEIFQELMEKMRPASHSRLKINFSGVGDPLDHPSFSSLIDSMYQGFEQSELFPQETVFYTQGGKLGADTAELLLRNLSPNCLNNLLICLDSCEADLYEKLHQGTPLDEVLKNIEAYLRAKKAYYDTRGLKAYCGPETAVVTTTLPELEEKIDGFFARWPSREQYLNEIQSSGNITAEKMNEHYEKFYRENLPLEHTVLVSPSHYCGQIPDRSLANFSPLQRFFCRRLENSLTVLCDGTIVPCDRVLVPDEESALGNIRDYDSIIDIWHHPKLLKWRQAHEQSDFEGLFLCSKCEDWYIPVD